METIMDAVFRHREFCQLIEGTLPFKIFRADTGQVLATGVYGYENAAAKANEIRKRFGLKWEQVKFKADRDSQKKTQQSPSSKGYRRYDYAPRYNPSKGKRFSGCYDKDGNFYDLD